MPTFPIIQVDAFTEKPLGGNPCAVIFDADDLTEITMLAIAREMNLSETAFVIHSLESDFGARFFTPAEEIPLAGHPTIATVHAMLESGRLVHSGDHTAITIELRDAPIQVDIFSGIGQRQQIVMTQRKPVFMDVYDPAEVLPAFNLSVDDLLPGYPIQTVSTGTPQLMIPLRQMDSLRRAYPDHGSYVKLRKRGDFFSPHLFCLDGVTGQGQTFARHFGVPPDTPEDPFTGSATGGMAAYMWRYGLIEQPVFVAEQGHWMNRPGQAMVEIVGPTHDITAVKVGGSAVTVLRGEFLL
ncbi:MAG: PhzF family phenazine biosynthesis protein [Candidatus Promineifilaceae bacterium]